MNQTYKKQASMNQDWKKQSSMKWALPKQLSEKLSELWIPLLFFCFLILPTHSKAASFYQIQGGFRSTPQSSSVEAQYVYNEKLWSGGSDDPAWMYGYWKLGTFVAIHGQAGMKVEFFPLSLWQIQLQRSMTSRFYDTKTVDCSLYECRGVLQRGSFKTSIALGYGDFFLVPSYSITDLTMDSPQKNFSSEEDNLVADKEGDQLVVFQEALGYKQGNQKWVFVAKTSYMKKSRDSNSSQYLVWSQSPDKNLSYFVGAGQYRSTYLKSSLSFVAGFSWTVGENLSFF